VSFRNRGGFVSGMRDARRRVRDRARAAAKRAELEALIERAFEGKALELRRRTRSAAPARVGGSST
jgi:hypothetical protein